MDPRFQTSFIPKKPIVAETNRRSVASINLFSFTSTTIFIIAVLLSGGLFFYQDLLTKQIEKKKSYLESTRSNLDPESITQLVRLDNRIEASKKLINSHIVVSPIFSFIGEITLPSVRFDTFSFSYGPENKVSISMNGQAQSYASVALQSDLLNKQTLLNDVVIGNMSVDSAGFISFTVSAVVDQSLVSYSIQ